MMKTEMEQERQGWVEGRAEFCGRVRLLDRVPDQGEKLCLGGFGESASGQCMGGQARLRRLNWSSRGDLKF